MLGVIALCVAFGLLALLWMALVVGRFVAADRTVVFASNYSQVDPANWTTSGESENRVWRTPVSEF